MPIPGTAGCQAATRFNKHRGGHLARPGCLNSQSYLRGTSIGSDRLDTQVTHRNVWNVEECPWYARVLGYYLFGGDIPCWAWTQHTGSGILTLQCLEGNYLHEDKCPPVMVIQHVSRIKTLKLPINMRKATTTMDATHGFNTNSIYFNCTCLLVNGVSRYVGLCVATTYPVPLAVQFRWPS